MPELPEVEVLVRHLAPLLKNRTVRDVSVRRQRVLAPTSEQQLALALRNATFTDLTRRGKYLLFTLQPSNKSAPFQLVGHLGMTGRIFLQPKTLPLPKHAAVVLDLGANNFVFEDTRYFGRFTLDLSAPAKLGPEPLGDEFTEKYLSSALKRSAQSIKVKLLDQTLVAGVGNIYASEALFRAGISPRLAARKLKLEQIKALRRSIREVLNQAIRYGSTVPLDFAGAGARDGLFYYGGTEKTPEFYEERLMVYDREGRPCAQCGTTIRRLVQAARSTFYCPHCQRAR